MRDVMSAVRSEYRRQRKRMAILCEMDVLARRLAAVERAHAGQTSSRRNPTRTEIRDFIAAHGPVGRGDVGRALGGSLNALDEQLKRLRRAGEIVVDGERPHRRYRAPQTKPAQPASSPLPPRPAQVVDCSGPTDLLALVAEHGPVSSARLRQLTGLGYQQVVEWGRLLARQRAVAFDGEGPDRIWRALAARDLRFEILQTIAAQPGALNERRIALALRASYEQVVESCARLLDDGDVTLPEGSGYVVAERSSSLEIVR
jgi:hypothetical protein